MSPHERDAGAGGGRERLDERALVEARGLVKRFPGIVANAGVDLTIRGGQVHALLGENGAGKSTLASMLAGLYQPDAGSIYMAGAPVRFHSPREALAVGIGMVHQHFRLVHRLSVAENVAVGDRSQPFVMSTPDVHRAVIELGERYGLPVQPDARVGDLTVGEQQRVEIVKMLYRGVDVLLLDEPTSVLTPPEIDALFLAVRRMTRAGKAVVFISHKLGEVLAIADRVTVMRDGHVISSAPTGTTTERELAELMVGRDLDVSIRQSSGPRRPTVLELSEITVARDPRRGQLRDVSLTVAGGEIVGIAGVSGNGQRALAEVAAGLIVPDVGRVVVSSLDVTGRGAVAVRAAGLAYVPEDRIGTGLAPNLTIAENLQLTHSHRALLDRRSWTEDARRLMEAFDIRAPGPNTVTSTLSGGNLQKVLLARELSTDPQILVAASPSRGLDVGAIADVRALLAERRSQGTGVLLISEDLDEIRALSDRILVIFEGRIVYGCNAEDVDVTELGLAMAGAKR